MCISGNGGSDSGSFDTYCVKLLGVSDKSLILTNIQQDHMTTYIIMKADLTDKRSLMSRKKL
ncbi:MAG: hypothetical protein B6245_03100 [Desulfobacteraceae bacterium 4572_88]|nr:MAG: hypothetical protein B6245_03100 [Desulfobacteraceae bacterium 4572_88]